SLTLRGGSGLASGVWWRLGCEARRGLDVVPLVVGVPRLRLASRQRRRGREGPKEEPRRGAGAAVWRTEGQFYAYDFTALIFPAVKRARHPPPRSRRPRAARGRPPRSR